MKVNELIKVLKTFPQDWEISIVDAVEQTEMYDIKGIYTDSEYDDMGYLMYQGVFIQLMPEYVDYGDWEMDKDCLEMYGDYNWYNTKAITKMTKYDNCEDEVEYFRSITTYKARLNEKGVLYPFKEH